MILKKQGLNKRRLSIIVTSSVLFVFIVAYVVLTAILPGIMSGASGGEKPEPPEIIESLGESTHANKATVYPYLNKGRITTITVESHEDWLKMVRPLNQDKTALLDYFVFKYKDGNEEREYYPAIADEDATFKYTDLYAVDTSNSLGVTKVDYFCAALTALYFEERIVLSSELAERTEQLNRYGLGREDRETITVEYLDENGKEASHKIYIGDKLITGIGYYFMLDGRDCVYTSVTSNALSTALGGFESFLHSRIIAAELEGDKGAAPYHTKNYSQWSSTYNKNVGDTVINDVEVIVNANYIQPIYKDVSGEGDEAVGKNTGYRSTGYRDVTFDLVSLKNSLGFERLIKALVGEKIGELTEEKTVSVITDMNEAALYDQSLGKGVYEYVIYKVEAVITEDGEISEVGTPAPRDALIKVEYGFTLDGTALTSERCHAVIDLGEQSVIPDSVKESLTAVGELSSPLSFEARYTPDNVKTRKIEYVITDISFIAEMNENGGVSYLDKVTEKSIVTYTFRYLLDGVDIGAGDVMTIDLSNAKEGHYLNVKNALVGKKAGAQNISVIDNVYCQPFMDFRAYSIKSIHGYVKTEETVAFKFVPEDQRDSFYGESIYKNILPDSHRYSHYAVNDEACDQVLRILGGIVANSNASGAQGIVGISTVAVGLNHANMDDYHLYEGHKIVFSLPRGLNPMAQSSEYEWLYDLEFVLYVSPVQPDGTRYVGSEMYDIVVKIDAKTFDFLDFSFPEYWARRNLAMINVSDIDKLGLEFFMEDVYGKYDFTLKHETFYYTSTDRYPTKPEGVTSNEYDYITVRVKPLGDRHSENETLKLLAERNVKDIDLAAVYNSVAGLGPGDKGLSVGYDTLGTSSFKDILMIIYKTYYLGVLEDGEQELGTEENLLMRLSFDVGSSSAYTYNYDFHRIDDRRVMISLYRLNSAGDKIGEVSDFYISTFAFKKLVGSCQDLLNGIRIDSESAY